MVPRPAQEPSLTAPPSTRHTQNPVTDGRQRASHLTLVGHVDVNSVSFVLPDGRPLLERGDACGSARGPRSR